MKSFKEYRDRFDSYEDLKELYGEDVEAYIERAYKEYLWINLNNIMGLFQARVYNEASNEELYNWCISLQTIFNIKDKKLNYDSAITQQ